MPGAQPPDRLTWQGKVGFSVVVGFQTDSRYQTTPVKSLVCYGVGQKVCLGFSIASYRLTWMNFLANPIHFEWSFQRVQRGLTSHWNQRAAQKKKKKKNGKEYWGRSPATQARSVEQWEHREPNRVIIWMFFELRTLWSLELILGGLGESSRPQSRFPILGSQGSPDMCELGSLLLPWVLGRVWQGQSAPGCPSAPSVVATDYRIGSGGRRARVMFLNAGNAVRDGPSTSLLLSVFTSFLVSSSLSSENSYDGERV